MKTISQRRHSVVIHGAEYPVDADLSFHRHDSSVGYWQTKSRYGVFDFKLDQPQQVFRSYQGAFTRSAAFSKQSFLRELFWRKEEGVKIVAGHGVFILPSNMILRQSKTGKISITVFAGSDLSKTFSHSNDQHLVEIAKSYYDDNFDEFNHRINYDLYRSVANRPGDEREIEGLVIPQGIRVQRRSHGYQVLATASRKTHYVGFAKDLDSIGKLIDKAELMREDKLEQKAAERRVVAEVLSFGEYLRRLD